MAANFKMTKTCGICHSSFDAIGRSLICKPCFERHENQIHYLRYTRDVAAAMYGTRSLHDESFNSPWVNIVEQLIAMLKKAANLELDKNRILCPYNRRAGNRSTMSDAQPFIQENVDLGEVFASQHPDLSEIVSDLTNGQTAQNLAVLSASINRFRTRDQPSQIGNQLIATTAENSTFLKNVMAIRRNYSRHNLGVLMEDLKAMDIHLDEMIQKHCTSYKPQCRCLGVNRLVAHSEIWPNDDGLVPMFEHLHIILEDVLYSVLHQTPLYGSDNVNYKEMNAFSIRSEMITIKKLLSSMLFSFDGWDTPMCKRPTDQLDSFPVDEEFVQRDILCTICWTSIELNDVCVTLKCGHTFHENGLKRWVKMRPTCPICRGRLPDTAEDCETALAANLLVLRQYRFDRITLDLFSFHRACSVMNLTAFGFVSRFQARYPESLPHIRSMMDYFRVPENATLVTTTLYAICNSYLAERFITTDLRISYCDSIDQPIQGAPMHRAHDETYDFTFEQEVGVFEMDPIETAILDSNLCKQSESADRLMDAMLGHLVAHELAGSYEAQRIMAELFGNPVQSALSELPFAYASEAEEADVATVEGAPVNEEDLDPLDMIIQAHQRCAHTHYYLTEGEDSELDSTSSNTSDYFGHSSQDGLELTFEPGNPYFLNSQPSIDDLVVNVQINGETNQQTLSVLMQGMDDNSSPVNSPMQVDVDSDFASIPDIAMDDESARSDSDTESESDGVVNLAELFSSAMADDADNNTNV